MDGEMKIETWLSIYAYSVPVGECPKFPILVSSLFFRVAWWDQSRQRGQSKCPSAEGEDGGWEEAKGQEQQLLEQ